MFKKKPTTKSQVLTDKIETTEANQHKNVSLQKNTTHSDDHDQIWKKTIIFMYKITKHIMYLRGGHHEPLKNCASNPSCYRSPQSCPCVIPIKHITYPNKTNDIEYKYLQWRYHRLPTETETLKIPMINTTNVSSHENYVKDTRQ